MSYIDQVKFATGFWGSNDGSDYRHFLMLKKIGPRLLDGQSHRVLEIGGWQGALAENINRNSGMVEWLNIDIAINSIIRNVNHSEMYRCIIQSDYIWNLWPSWFKADSFVACHVLEHLKSAEICKLIRCIQLDSGIKQIYIDVPIENSKRMNWDDYEGTHIIDISYDELIEIFTEHGFDLKHKEGTYAEFKRK